MKTTRRVVLSLATIFSFQLFLQANNGTEPTLNQQEQILRDFVIEALPPSNHKSIELINDITDLDALEREENQDFPTSRELVRVREGRSLPIEEISAIKKRLPKVKASVERIVNETVSYKHLPNISVVASGGGYRAMIASLGLTQGLQNINMLDSVMYMATLSGSTWFLGNWLAQNVPLRSFRALLQEQASTHLLTTPLSMEASYKTLYKKVKNSQDTSLIDMWGMLLANSFMRNLTPGGRKVYLSELAPNLDAGNFPLPIFTSVGSFNNDYVWFEYSPFEIGSHELGAFIPTKTFNSKFENGVTTSIDAEQTLGFLMGIFGSAFSVNARDLVRIFKDKIPGKTLTFALDKITQIMDFGGWRVTAAKVRNFTYGMRNQAMREKKRLTLMDGGIGFNLPLPPMLRRDVDIYIFCDASTSSEKGGALRKAMEYAQKNGYKFPRIDYSILGEQRVSIFMDYNDPSVPMVIYVQNELDFKTTKFEYTPSEFTQLSNHMIRAVEDNYEAFYEAVKIKVKQLQQLHRSTSWAHINVEEPEALTEQFLIPATA